MPCGDSTSVKLFKKAFLSPNFNIWLKTTRQPDAEQVGKVVLGMLVTRCPSRGYNRPVQETWV